MTVNYKLLKTYGRLPKNAEYRAVAIDNQTVELDQIGEEIEHSTSLTHADLIGAVRALNDEVAHQLMAGNAVHLPGLGYFSLAVKGDIYEDPRSHHYRLHNPEVRTVKFRPDAEMKERLRSTEFNNITYEQGVSSVPTAQDIDNAIDELFAIKPVITVADLRRRLNLSSAYSYRIADRLTKEGKLRNVGSWHRKVYVKGNGNG
ncbi:DNA-binding domain-containing protein [Prevotella denticola]|uniref:Putative DNA-binding protein n=1 Tax=Prevotella denticola TaxID=28129 RepID=A0A379E3W1_9BACT|nr:DNA-binding domain-containing protein [Prevotella denticola]SUB87427.1 putative DNA-binding protein [Prevotella denticola]